MPATASALSALEITGSSSAAGGPSFSSGKPLAAGPGSGTRSAARRILILDDEQDFLDTYGRILARLPSHPEVRVATCAMRAMALLEAEAFTLLITDLRMPKIDGFQVLLGARKRFPTLKTVAITALGDQQYRARAYASGIDLYTEKPTTPTEIRLFSECVEALLMQGIEESGFRGFQSKSLMDLIQVECLSQAATLLRITHGSLEGRIWIHGGCVIDAAAGELQGEDAFRQIFSWKSGHFEIMPGDPARTRTIFTSYESLLLDSAHALDESAANGAATPADGMLEAPRMARALQPMATVRGVESLVLVSGPGQCESWGVDSPEEYAGWTHRVLKEFQALGESLNAGPLRGIECTGRVRNLVLLPGEGRHLLAGMDRRFTPRALRDAGRQLATHLAKES